MKIINETVTYLLQEQMLISKSVGLTLTVSHGFGKVKMKKVSEEIFRNSMVYVCIPEAHVLAVM